MPKEVTLKFPGVESGQFKVDAAEITVPEEAVPQVETLIKNVFDANDHIVKLQGEVEGLTGERDTLQRQVEDAEAETISPEELDALSEERRVVIDVAEHVGFKRDELKAAGNAEIKSMVVRKDDAETPEDAAPLYLDGCFRQIQKRMDAEHSAKKATAKLGDITKPIHQDTGAGEGGGEPEMSYREAAQLKMDGVHNKTDEELAKEGWRN